MAELHSELGDVAAAFAAADFIHEQTYRTQRVQHTALETHAAIASIDDDGRLQVRTSSQVPFLVRRTLGRVFGLPEDRIRVVAGRVGGGFGGKQEVLTEDIVALAALKLRRPVQLEFTRTEQFTASHHPAPVHHPPQGRRQQRRQADGPAAGGPDQRRRLRQPRPWA